jgi:DNA (cytosine-5)-methyltransferase 1
MGYPKFISLFSGAGGLDLGFERAGWQRQYASDIDPVAIETLVHNAGDAGSNVIECANIRSLSTEDVLAKAGNARRGEIDAVVGGPPCQSWSSAGHQRGFEDPRGQLFSDFVRLAEDIDARWIVFENVRGLLTARGEDGRPGTALESIRKQLLKAGWQTTVQLINAADYGVAQRRIRLFVIGYREGDCPNFPQATHAKGGTDGLKPWVTLGDCLKSIRPPSAGELIRPTGKMALELATIAPGRGVKSPGKKETTRPGGHWGYKQGAFVADTAQPARTVTASSQQDWIVDPTYGLRRLLPRECAAIQSFPTDWYWAGAQAAQYRQIGNAVPPLVAEAIGGALKSHMKAYSIADKHSYPIKLAPLAPELERAIHYTVKEDFRNGESRRTAPNRRSVRAVVNG